MRTRAAVVLALIAMATPAMSQTLPATGSEATDQPVADSADETEVSEDWVPATGASKLAIARPPYPREIQASLDYGRKLCREEGGESLTYPEGIVRTGDLTGDGRADYIVDFRGSKCAERLYMFNGTGGWDFEIHVARRNGRLALVFGDRIRDYDISKGPGTRTMTFTLHGGYCGLAGADDCTRKRRIDGRRFEFRER